MGNPERQGGSHSVFIGCDDNQVYNVKFKENNQGLRVLANELVAAGLAHLLEVPTPEIRLVEITSPFLSAKGNEFLQRLYAAPVSVGLHFGSHRIGGVENRAVPGHLTKCANRITFPGFFTFDIWTNNSDRKMDHCLVVRPDFHPRGFYVTSVDHGHCFGRPAWTVGIDAQIGTWCKSSIPEMAALVEGETAFSPWLASLKAISEVQVDGVLSDVPTEWGVSAEDNAALRRFILGQREKVSDILEDSRSLFPNWRGGTGR